jgi:hypothetical protein
LNCIGMINLLTMYNAQLRTYWISTHTTLRTIYKEEEFRLGDEHDPEGWVCSDQVWRTYNGRKLQVGRLLFEYVSKHYFCQFMKRTSRWPYAYIYCECLMTKMGLHSSIYRVCVYDRRPQTHRFGRQYWFVCQRHPSFACNAR